MSNRQKEFWGGVVLIFLGLVIVLMNTTIRFALYSFNLGGVGLTSGLLLIPLFIGIILWIALKQKIIGKLIVWSSLACLVIALILSVRITLNSMSAFSLIIMFAPIIIGVGLVIRSILLIKSGD